MLNGLNIETINAVLLALKKHFPFRDPFPSQVNATHPCSEALSRKKEHPSPPGG